MTLGYILQYAFSQRSPAGLSSNGEVTYSITQLILVSFPVSFLYFSLRASGINFPLNYWHPNLSRDLLLGKPKPRHCSKLPPLICHHSRVARIQGFRKEYSFMSEHIMSEMWENTQDNPLGKNGNREYLGRLWELGAKSATRVADCHAERCRLICHCKFCLGLILLLGFHCKMGKTSEFL